MSQQKPTFDMEAAIAALREGRDLTGKRVFKTLCQPNGFYKLM